MNKLTFERLVEMADAFIEDSSVWGLEKRASTLNNPDMSLSFAQWRWTRGFRNTCSLSVSLKIKSDTKSFVPVFSVNFPAINDGPQAVAAQVVLLKAVSDMALSLQDWVDNEVELVMEKTKKK